jgi:beta-glucosidase/6-phospho-beta-glucosidase/beta-galactosidase
MEFNLGWFANPIYSKDGDYPKVMRDNVNANSDKEGRSSSRLPTFTADEIKMIQGTADFFALNYYSSRIVYKMQNPPAQYDWEADAGIRQVVDPEWKRGKSDFLYVVPEGLHKLLVWIKEKYDNPVVVIAENGYSDDGQIVDDERISYIKDHLAAVRSAINDGCNVKAYTVWSLLDNFEWARGYSEKFGIVGVNFTSPNRERTPKKSSEYFGNVIKARKVLDNK